MRKPFFVSVLILTVVIVMIFPAIVSAAGSTYYVATTGSDVTGDGSAGNPWATIQYAIDNSLSGDTINVAAGTYSEYLHITTDDLTLEGAGIDLSIIDLDGLTPYWHYPSSSSYASRAGVLISGYGSPDEIVEGVTFRGFTVKNAGLNPPTTAIGTHTGSDDAAVLTDSAASWTPGALVGEWIHNLGDRDTDYSPARSYGQITANTATTVTATLSGGVDNDWDNGDTYVITSYKHFYDQYGDGQEDIRGIVVANGKDALIQNCKVTNSGYAGISVGKARSVSTHKYSEGVTIDNCVSSGNPVSGISVGDYKGSVTITNNICSNNKRPNLADPTREYSGYGIHLSGAKSSLTISGVISDNTVTDNGFEGIVLAKYTDGIIVEDNVVTGHNSDQDGAGIFAYYWGYPERSKNHIIRDNTVTGNIRGIVAYYVSDSIIENNIITTDSGTFPEGQPAIKLDGSNNITVKNNIIGTSDLDGIGISVVYWEDSGSVSSHGNTIIGNTITGAKFAGILISGEAHDNTFVCNKITGTTSLTLWAGTSYEETQADGVFIDDDAGIDNVFHYNKIYDNNDDGMENQVDTTTVDAENNWWGDASGPTHSSNPSGTGDEVSDNIDFDPWLTSPPPTTVESADSGGSTKNTFGVAEPIFVTGSGYSSSATYDLYLVDDIASWSCGMTIPGRAIGTETSVTTDSSGNIPAGTLAWSSGIIGQYDIVVDVNGNGKYDECIDALDDSDINVTAGFNVIPEIPLGTVTALITALAALIVYKKRAAIKT